MRILHTSDWHLGKLLDGFSRLEEQEEFIEELTSIAEDKSIDMVIIAGDIYDTSNPPSRAEKLFYRALKKLSKDGRRAIIVIAGNHDNPERLAAAAPIATDHGIILFGGPLSNVEAGRCGRFEVVDFGEGFIELCINGENAVVVAIPYPSEKRLNEIIGESMSEEDRSISYGEKVEELFLRYSDRYREDTVNIAVSHLFMAGGEESVDSERPIQLGGSFIVSGDKLPKNAQYVALGHLHKAQRVKGTNLNAYYSGSPIQYSKHEADFAKCVYVADISPREEARVEEVFLKNYKPIELWEFDSVEAALNRCREDCERSIWVYIKINTDRVLTGAEIKEMKSVRPGIIEIRAESKEDSQASEDAYDIKEKSLQEQFCEFYSREREGLKPTEELLELFLSMTLEEEESDEA